MPIKMNDGSKTVSVTMTDGTCRGFISGGIRRFLGIPFAEAERWKPPHAPACGGEINALSFGPSPWQNAEAEMTDIPAGMSEDCLNLNLYAADNGIKNKAVMVWIYGGAQIAGNNIGTRPAAGMGPGFSYDPSALLAEYPQVIVAVPNYRVGIWGSVDLSELEQDDPDYRFSRNLARLDILECLRWIKRNIAAFGGDPENITLFGQSAGSSNITALMLMKESEGLFQKAVCQSSFSLDISLTAKKDCRTVSKAFFEHLGCSPRQALEKSAEELLEAQKKLAAASMGGSPAFEDIESKLFSPVVDSVLIPENYWELLMKGERGNIKLMCGTNEGEYDRQFDAVCAGDCEKARGLVVAHCRGKLDPVKGRAPGVTDEFIAQREDIQLFTAYENLKADLYLRMGAMSYALVRQQFEDTYCCFLALPLPGERFYHGAEIPALFSGETHISEADCRLIRELWCTFAISGVPYVHGSRDVWRPFKKGSWETLYVSSGGAFTVNGVRRTDCELLLPLLKEYPAYPDFAALCGAEKP